MTGPSTRTNQTNPHQYSLIKLPKSLRLSLLFFFLDNFPSTFDRTILYPKIDRIYTVAIKITEKNTHKQSLLYERRLISSRFCSTVSLRNPQGLLVSLGLNFNGKIYHNFQFTHKTTLEINYQSKISGNTDYGVRSF